MNEHKKTLPEPLPKSTRSLVSGVIRQAFPMAGSRLLQMLTGFIGVLMLAHMGHTVLAASILMTSTQITVIVVFISLLFSMSVISGQAFGAKQYAEVGAIMRQGCVMALLVTIPMIVLFLFADRILLATGQLPQLMSLIKEYFYALVWGVPSFVLQAAIQQALYGMSRQRLVITINFICLLIFVPTAYVLIYGAGFIPAQGVAGLPYAYAVQGYMSLLILFGCLRFNKSLQAVKFFSRTQGKKWHHFKQIFHIGWPMSVQFGGELMGFFVVSVMVGWLGTNAMAASQVVQQCLMLFLVPMFAIAEATGIIVSQAVGADRHNEVKRIGEVCLVVATLIVLVVGLGFMLFPYQLALLYLNPQDVHNQQILYYIKILFILAAFALLFDTWRQIATGALRGFFDTRFAMWVGVLIIWLISVPLSYSMAFFTGLGVIGLRCGGLVAFLIGAILVWQHWRQRVRAFATPQILTKD